MLGKQVTLKSISALVASVIIGMTAVPASAWWQFVAKGPNGERRVSLHYDTLKECKNALKQTESVLARRFPDRYPLVGSCEEYR
jgi:hypothetical protein